MARDNSLVEAEIHRKGLENIINEMAITLVRTSGSPIVTDANDFSTCLLDANGDQLGIATNFLCHSASSLFGTKAVLRDLAASGEDVRPGDSWLVNDPYEGGAMHQGDMGVISPIFYRDEVVAWAFCNMHLVDVGGSGVSGIAPGARTVYDEGLRFPPIRAIRDGRIGATWEKYIAANVRAPSPVLNDIRSMIAASNVAQTKLTTLLDRTGLDDFHGYSKVNVALTEELFRKRISDIPDGTYEAVDFVEFDGQGSDELYEVRGTLEVAGSDMTFSFSGADQIPAFINGTKAAVHGNLMTILMTTLAYGDLPFNAGMWAPVTIDVGREGTIVNATAPAPVSTAHVEGGARAGKVAKYALNQALSLSENPTLRGRVAGVPSDGMATAGLFGVDDDQRPAVLYYMDPGAGIGGPAQTIVDGQDSYGMAMMGGCGIPDVEVHESTDPVLILWRKIAANTGGPGQLRGGQGMDQAYVIHKSDYMAGFFSAVAAEVPPAGFGGGLAAAGSTQFPIRSTDAMDLFAQGVHPTAESLGGTREAANNKDGGVVFRRHDVLQYINGGGSGLGDPLLRPDALVVKDVTDGYVTADHAAAVYGVVLVDGVLDEAATVATKEELRRARIGATPRRDLSAPSSIGVAVVLTRGEGSTTWACGYCAHEFCAADEDWRTHGNLLVEEDIRDAFERMHMQVIPRRQDPQVMVRTYYCEECAGALHNEVLPEGASAPMPKLASV